MVRDVTEKNLEIQTEIQIKVPLDKVRVRMETYHHLHSQNSHCSHLSLSLIHI